jgi:hypothetical protein
MGGGMLYITGKKQLICKQIQKQARNLHQVIERLPRENECYKLISTGGFSSIAFIIHIAVTEGINHLYVSTLTIGKNELQTLITLHTNKNLKNANLYVGRLMKNSQNEKDYAYFAYMVETCKKYGWHFRVIKNHSKVILIETALGNKYVIETSSNLTDNPNVEQFSFECDTGLFGFYRDFLQGLEGDDYGGDGQE